MESHRLFQDSSSASNRGASVASPVITGANHLPAHKYLVSMNLQSDTVDNQSSIFLAQSSPWTIRGSTGQFTTTTTKQKYTKIITANGIWEQILVSYTGDNLIFSDMFLIDLTQWFNGDIPQDILDNPENFFRYYQGSLAYNTGTLVNADGRYIKCIGMNQWDEVWEEGTINPATGQNVDSSAAIRSKNYIKVIPNATYNFHIPWFYLHLYDANKNFIEAKQTNGVSDQLPSINDNGKCYNIQFTIPSNCCYIRIRITSVYGATYKNDISINLYYEDEARCLTYEPYRVLTNNDTGEETLLAFDTKDADGTIHHNTKNIDLSTLTFTYNSGSHWWQTASGVSALTGLTGTNTGNFKCDKYTPLAVANYESGVNGNIMINSGNAQCIVISNDSSNAPSGNVQVQLAEPTTEQGTPFSENLIIDDFGSMDFGSNVPQGALIFYPVDYKAFIDTLYKYTDGTPSDIALKSDLSADKTELQGVDTQLKNALGGTLRQCLCVKESLDFDNTDFVDLGELSWTYNGTYQVFIAQVSNIKQDNNGKVISSMYATATTTVTSMANKTVRGYDSAFSSGANVYVKDTTYTDATAFKNAMKGILLAYEKAE